VRLTERGRAAQAAAERVLGELDEELARSLDDRDRDALIRALKGVIDL
jgi:DNA-binding MarR family transcriptional regulator